jgi:SNF2 family DNA or RNA helicase
MAPDQAEFYRQIIAATQSDLKELLHTPGDPRARIPLLAALTRLRQACCDPRLIIGEHGDSLSSTKLQMLSDLLVDFLASGRRIIIYSQFVKMQRLIHDLLTKIGVSDALWLHGGTRDRAEVVRRFQDPDGPRVIVVSLKAGGTGVTLTAADTVIFYDPWWNPAIEDQAADRAHRIGQTKTVHVVKLICAGSIEEQIHQLSLSKREHAESVLTTDRVGLRTLTLEDIQQLISHEIERLT